MEPAIESARAMLPSWVPWANVAMHPPLAFITTLLAATIAAGLATRVRALSSCFAALNALALGAPLLWAVAAASAAGPIGHAPWWTLAPLTAVAALLAALVVRGAARWIARRHQIGLAPRLDRASLRAAGVGLLLCASVALSLRAFAGQAWSRDREVRLFAVAFTGGHDRTLADLAWVTAQRGDQRGAAVLLQAAMLAESSAVPSANLAIVFVNEGRCREAADALREARRRVAAGASDRDRALLRSATEALRTCEARGLPAPMTEGS